ncbi:MAG: chlorite dismutase family protein [Sedimenticola selenatireducens]|uniref:Chlorite dismutase family protein n=2 Tax=Sedimenticola TaxID=349742 RepID=A0A558CRW6_9GAMM|nr:MAG: chlorite dismutase [Sedimenticola selenatireducens]TVO68317.1 chlorite dismutase family protein [Sedimenticola selenatireducens]TVT51507.1 MAG: chlorite dismutase family protein [Sedimenticola thiotaurini]TVT60916.1 MAG: chlorite dismutase family protein [Sedimenticola selenatireducens]
MHQCDWCFTPVRFLATGVILESLNNLALRYREGDNTVNKSKRILTAIVGIGLMGMATLAVAADKMMVDPAKILSETNVYGLYNTFKVQPSYYQISMADRSKAAAEVEAVVKKHSDSVFVQAYLTRGFKSESDFLLRMHAYEPAAAQAFLTDFSATSLGRNSKATLALIGVTKGLNHTTKEKSPNLLNALKSTSYSADAPKYAFVIPIDKSPEWWNKTEKEKLAMMEDHTIPTLPYLVNVKRKLYHSTGLDDTDFITYFETSDLVAFNNLNIALHSVSEMLYNTRYGDPIVMGTIMSVTDVVEAISK